MEPRFQIVNFDYLNRLDNINHDDLVFIESPELNFSSQLSTILKGIRNYFKHLLIVVFIVGLFILLCNILIQRKPVVDLSRVVSNFNNYSYFNINNNVIRRHMMEFSNGSSMQEEIGMENVKVYEKEEKEIVLEIQSSISNTNNTSDSSSNTSNNSKSYSLLSDILKYSLRKYSYKGHWSINKIKNQEEENKEKLSNIKTNNSSNPNTITNTNNTSNTKKSKNTKSNSIMNLFSDFESPKNGSAWLKLEYFKARNFLLYNNPYGYDYTNIILDNNNNNTIITDINNNNTESIAFSASDSASTSNKVINQENQTFLNNTITMTDNINMETTMAGNSSIKNTTEIISTYNNTTTPNYIPYLIEFLDLKIRLNDGLPTENWVFLSSKIDINSNDITINEIPTKDNYTKIYNIKANTTFILEKGVFFEGTQIIERKQGKINIKIISFSNNTTTTQINTTNTTTNIIYKDLIYTKIQAEIQFNELPNIIFTLTGIIYDSQEDYPKILHYSILLTLFTILQMASISHMSQQVIDYPTYADGLSVIHIIIDLVWNSFACLIHFLFAIMHSLYAWFFGIPSLLLFLQFTFIELRFMYLTWNKQNIRDLDNPYIIRKKLARFYFLFYSIIFISMFFVMKFFFYKNYIVFAVSILWIPQILYNALYNVKKIPPVQYIVMQSLNRVYLPFYFRGCPSNFLEFKHDVPFIVMCMGIVLAEIAVLYLQGVKNPRFFIPYKKQIFEFIVNRLRWGQWYILSEIEEHDFYCSKEELMKKKPEAINVSSYMVCIFLLFVIYIFVLFY